MATKPTFRPAGGTPLILSLLVLLTRGQQQPEEPKVPKERIDLVPKEIMDNGGWPTGVSLWSDIPMKINLRSYPTHHSDAVDKVKPLERRNERRDSYHQKRTGQQQTWNTSPALKFFGSEGRPAGSKTEHKTSRSGRQFGSDFGSSDEIGPEVFSGEADRGHRDTFRAFGFGDDDSSQEVQEDNRHHHLGLSGGSSGSGGSSAGGGFKGSDDDFGARFHSDLAKFAENFQSNFGQGFGRFSSAGHPNSGEHDGGEDHHDGGGSSFGSFGDEDGVRADDDHFGGGFQRPNKYQEDHPDGFRDYNYEDIDGPTRPDLGYHGRPDRSGYGHPGRGGGHRGGHPQGSAGPSSGYSHFYSPGSWDHSRGGAGGSQGPSRVPNRAIPGGNSISSMIGDFGLYVDDDDGYDRSSYNHGVDNSEEAPPGFGLVGNAGQRSPSPFEHQTQGHSYRSPIQRTEDTAQGILGPAPPSGSAGEDKPMKLYTIYKPASLTSPPQGPKPEYDAYGNLKATPGPFSEGKGRQRVPFGMESRELEMTASSSTSLDSMGFGDKEESGYEVAAKELDLAESHGWMPIGMQTSGVSEAPAVGPTQPPPAASNLV